MTSPDRMGDDISRCISVPTSERGVRCKDMKGGKAVILFRIGCVLANKTGSSAGSGKC